MNLITSHSPLKEFLEEFRRFLIEHDISCEQGRILGISCAKQRPETDAAWIALRKRWSEIDFLLSAVPVVSRIQPEKEIKSNWFRDYLDTVDLYLRTPYGSDNHPQILKRLCDVHETAVSRLLVHSIGKSTSKGGDK
jgi:hypothetical protein